MLSQIDMAAYLNALVRTLNIWPHSIGWVGFFGIITPTVNNGPIAMFGGGRKKQKGN